MPTGGRKAQVATRPAQKARQRSQKVKRRKRGRLRQQASATTENPSPSGCRSSVAKPLVRKTRTSRQRRPATKQAKGKPPGQPKITEGIAELHPTHPTGVTKGSATTKVKGKW